MKVLITGGNGNIAKMITRNFDHKVNITAPLRQELDVSNGEQLKEYLSRYDFDVLIHTAISGGRRTVPDTAEFFYKNVLMMENILTFRDKFKMIINLDSAAIYDRSTDIMNRKENEVYHVPADYYGFSKYVTYNRTLQFTNFFNFRIFNIFHEFEERDRFIKACFISKFNKTVLTIHEDKYFDFVSEGDFMRILAFYLENINSSHVLEKVINVCYTEKYKLSDIAGIIQPDRALIRVDQPTSDRNYTGDNTLLRQMNIKLDGMKVSVANYNCKETQVKQGLPPPKEAMVGGNLES